MSRAFDDRDSIIRAQEYELAEYAKLNDDLIELCDTLVAEKEALKAELGRIKPFARACNCATHMLDMFWPRPRDYT